MKEKEKVVVYVDGSYFEQGEFAGSGVYFGRDSPLNLVQYLPEEKGQKKTPLRAEVYASVLAVRQAHVHGIKRLVIKQDCKEAIRLLETTLATTKDLLLQQYLKSRRWVHVDFMWIKSHQDLNGGADEDVFGNHAADQMAKLAANLTRYRDAVLDMDQKNPLQKPLPSAADASRKTRVENVGKWLDEMKSLEQLMARLEDNVENKHEVVEALPRSVLEAMWPDADLRRRLLACHSPHKTLFCYLVKSMPDTAYSAMVGHNGGSNHWLPSRSSRP
jgi:ribonuclease HI